MDRNKFAVEEPTSGWELTHLSGRGIRALVDITKS